MTDARGDTTSSRTEEGRDSPLRTVALVAARWKLLLGLPVLVAASALLFSFLLPQRYTVESRFVPESSGPNVSRLAGLAAQFGVSVPGSESGESIEFYAELLESQDLLRSVVLTEFSFATQQGDSIEGTLVRLLDAKGQSDDQRTLNAVEQLNDMVTTRPDPGANMVTLRTSAPWPELSVHINARLLDLLSEFNLERRQSRAAEERRFLEARLREAESDLRAAERDLGSFLSENRRYDESSQLIFEHGRLQRRVSLREELHRSLAQAYEQARVDEVRNTPVITVIDHPRGPAKKTAPNLVINALLGLVLGVLLAIGIVIAGQLLDTLRRADPEGYDRLISLRFGGRADRA